MEADNRNFYGTIPWGGGSGAGTIYVVTPPGSKETLYEFSDRQTGIPESLLQASDGMLYGTARGEYNTGFHGYSRVFRFDPLDAVIPNDL
ncbi:MAG: choice-of-anchor tandem repeat GloVer-containing protein [Bryobacteraceae bacterium]